MGLELPPKLTLNHNILNYYRMELWSNYQMIGKPFAQKTISGSHQILRVKMGWLMKYMMTMIIVTVESHMKNMVVTTDMTMTP